MPTGSTTSRSSRSVLIPDDANDLIGLVKSIEDALDIVRGRHRDLGMTLARADIELLVEAKKSTTIGGELPLVPIDVGFEGKWTDVQTFGLTLTPAAGVGDLAGVDVKDELANGILAIAAAVKKINDLHKKTWVTSNPKVKVNVERERTGKLKIGGGGGRSDRRTHTITLTFILP